MLRRRAVPIVVSCVMMILILIIEEMMGSLIYVWQKTYHHSKCDGETQKWHVKSAHIHKIVTMRAMMESVLVEDRRTVGNETIQTTPCGGKHHPKPHHTKTNKTTHFLLCSRKVGYDEDKAWLCSKLTQQIILKKLTQQKDCAC